MTRRSGKARSKNSHHPFDFQLPNAARIPRREVPDVALFRRAAEIAADAGVGAHARLREIADRMRSRRDTSRRDETAGEEVGTVGRGLLGVECTHYLPLNRFEWWGVEARGGVPETGAIGAGEEGLTLEANFSNEFCSSLATVVGTDLEGLYRWSLSQKRPWDVLASGSSPNNAPLIEFSLRADRAGFVPTIVMVDVLTRDELGKPDPQKIPQKVVINAVEEGRVVTPGRAWPSSIIEFVIPQRAVALEFGYLGGGHINPRDVHLIARDPHGERIFTAPAFSAVIGDSVANLIGVRDRNGNIGSVELRFENLEQTERPIPFPPIIYRIWHEPLPPAVVRQGTVESVWYGPNDGRNQETPVCEKLPFHCSRYVRMIRGFRLEFTDGESHEVSGLSVRLETVGQNRTCPEGRIELVARGGIRANDVERSYNGYRLKIYYTLLAWDPEQMEVSWASAHVGGLAYEHSYGRVVVNDPCSPPGQAPCSNRYGAVADALQSFSCTVWGDQMEYLEFFVHPPRRIQGYYPPSSLVTPEPVGVSVDIHGPSDPTLSSLLWNMQGLIEADRGGRHRWDLSGQLISGASVLPPQSTRLDKVLIFSQERHIRRADRPWYLLPRRNIVAPIDADIAFVSLEFIWFVDLDEVHALDVEVIGDDYDGSYVVWKIGMETEDYMALVTPRVGGLVRRMRRPRTSLSKRDVRFDGITDVTSLEPEQYGFVRNEGNLPVLVTGVRQGGDHHGEFDVRFEYRGDVFSVGDMLHRTPLRLDPGESLTIGGRFLTHQAEADRSAWIQVRSNSVEVPFVVVNLDARMIPSRADGVWFPPVYLFGHVALGHTQTRTAAIQSVGATPLLVRALTIRPPAGSVTPADTGFSVVLPSPEHWRDVQIQPGHSLDLLVTFAPTAAGLIETDLVADTNAGRLELPLSGTGTA